jgi:hypothetical protein
LSPFQRSESGARVDSTRFLGCAFDFERNGECFSSGCTANTGYTGGGGGEAFEENVGLSGTHTYSGYIYP